MWRTLSGPQKGQEGTEKIFSVEVAPGVFFISRLEKSGVSVSNVVDFRSGSVAAFVTFDAGDSRMATFDKGTLQDIAIDRQVTVGLRK